jgi:hypothetical protein
VPREAVDEIDSYIRDDLELRISLPWENIEAWKEQLRKKLA